MADKQTPLVSPDGERQWTPTSPTERTNLLAQGWKPQGAPAAADKTATKKS